MIASFLERLKLAKQYYLKLTEVVQQENKIIYCMQGAMKKAFTTSGNNIRYH